MVQARDMAEVFSYIDEHQRQALDELTRFCAQESVSTENRGMAAMLALVQERLARSNFAVEVVPLAGGFPAIYAESRDEAPDDAPVLLIYDHYDVQPEGDPALWTSPPFEPTIRDGKLFARGVSDNKGNIVARLAAIDALRAVFGQLPLKIKWVIEGEEEIGSPNLDLFLIGNRERLQADGCVWEFGTFDWGGTPEIMLGLKGMLLVELRAQGPSRDLHSSVAAYVGNPVWRLVWALGTLKDENEYICIDGFYDRLRPPSEAELKAVAALPNDDAVLLQEMGVAEFALGLSGYQRRVAEVFSPTCNIQGVWGGYTGSGSKTILPATASAKLDLRLVPDQDPEEVLDLLRQHLAAKGCGDIEVLLVEGSVNPARTDPDAPFVKLTRNVCAELMGGTQPIIYPSSAASGPMYSFTDGLGVPVVAIGTGYPASGPHSPDENIRLSDFSQGTKQIALLIQRMAEAGAAHFRATAPETAAEDQASPEQQNNAADPDAATGLPDFDFAAIAAEMEDGGIEESRALPAAQRPDVDEALADVTRAQELADAILTKDVLGADSGKDGLPGG